MIPVRLWIPAPGVWRKRRLMYGPETDARCGFGPARPTFRAQFNSFASMPLPDTVSSYASDFLHLREIADDLEKLKEAPR